MSAISTGLLKTIHELQSLESIKDAALGGIFDLDGEISPLDDPLRLLKFDEGHAHSKITLPHHSQNRVNIVEGQKNWAVARSSWRKKGGKTGLKIHLKNESLLVGMKNDQQSQKLIDQYYV